MVLKVYGCPMSCARLVTLICKEKEIPYEFVHVDLLKGEHKAPEFNHLDDDGFILYESRAIARYLIKKYSDQGTPDLIPGSNDPKAEALFEQAASVEISHFHSHASVIVGERLVKPRYGGETDQAKVKENLKSLETKLDVYESILNKQEYLASDKLTLADLQHLVYATALHSAGLGYLFEKRPNLARWWNNIYNRPTWQAVKDGAHGK